MIPNFYVNQKFYDFDDFAATLQSWDIKINQLKPGTRVNILKQLHTKKMTISSGFINGHTQQMGDPPPFGCTISLLADTESNIIWRNKKVPADGIMLIPANSELDITTKFKAGIHTISPSKEILDSIVKRTGVQKLFQKNGLISIPMARANELRSLVCKYFFFLDQYPELASNLAFTNGFITDLSKKLATSLEKIENPAETRQSVNKALAWKRIENFFERNIGSPVTIGDLSETAGVSERTLQRLFHERFDVSPKTYVNITRLNGVHRALKQAPTPKSKISDIANHWGFWHMGQLAADYKNLFGELPSATLKK